MPAPIGSRNNPYGRPRRLDVELGRLTTAAAHARGILGDKMLLNALTLKEDGRGLFEQEMAAAQAELREIERRAEDLRWLAEEIESTSPGRKRRRPKLDAYVAERIRAALALDRLCGEESPQ